MYVALSQIAAIATRGWAPRIAQWEIPIFPTPIRPTRIGGLVGPPPLAVSAESSGVDAVRS